MNLNIFVQKIDSLNIWRLWSFSFASKRDETRGSGQTYTFAQIKTTTRVRSLIVGDEKTFQNWSIVLHLRGMTGMTRTIPFGPGHTLTGMDSLTIPHQDSCGTILRWEILSYQDYPKPTPTIMFYAFRCLCLIRALGECWGHGQCILSHYFEKQSNSTILWNLIFWQLPRGNWEFCFRILALSSHPVRGQASHEHLCQYIYRFWALTPVSIFSHDDQTRPDQTRLV